MQSSLSNPYLLITAIVVVLLALPTVPAVTAAPGATENVISILRIDQRPHAPDLNVVTTRLTVPPQAQWETNPDAGPLTVTVETGALGVMLGDGSARVERRPDPLLGGHISPVSLDERTVLWPGDRLVIVRGFELTVTNDEDEPASAIVSRLRQAPTPIKYGDQ
jgi:hypothetical protein